MRAFLADCISGYLVALVNDWSAFTMTAIILLLRIILEWFLIKNKRKEKE
jgi:hypothetical protein